MLDWFLLFVALSPVSFCQVAVTFDELRSLGARCPDKDTCNRPFDDDMRRVNCQCGSRCSSLGTCCLDAPGNFLAAGRPYGVGLGCLVPFGSGPAVFMVDKCSQSWEGDDSVRDLCAGDGKEKDDLLLSVPVSSLAKRVTYKNYFCFLCNGDSDEFISWDIGIDFSNRSLASLIDLSDLSYNSSIGWTHPRVPQFTIVRLQARPPKVLAKDHTVYCYQHTISRCFSNWTEPETKAKCGSYTALLKVGYTTYKNVHCAICNWERTDSTKCYPGFDKRNYGYSIVTTSAKVFQELFFKISELPCGECREGQMYDKISKKCRNVLCGRKMKMVKGRCVRKS